MRDTGELFLMGAEEGIQVEVLGVLLGLDAVERALEGWEEAKAEPNSVEWILTRLAEAPEPEARPEAAPTRSLEQVVDESVGAAEPEWWSPPASIGWIASELDDLGLAYEELRSHLDPNAALQRAVEDVLDEGSRERLTEFFAGEMDVVYGDGVGERTRVEMRDALERQREDGSA